MRNETGKSNPSNPTDILGRSLKTLSRHNEELFDAPRRYIKKSCDRNKLYKASRQVIDTQTETYAAKSCFQELCCVTVVLS
ncbi:hypothetical protein NA56DRAFT_753056 [Hyaloscypha hepaticicola]|uniref:Uncharacterized protein n=1 Tax=Hyaloscypha hepaticicola TaxID=2082293 RepID=A0A2J6PR70_9HELO|nr:hypothetical protein NA56DRAFT_753056 [Hyaloscypha hepaticicola]